MSTYVVGRYHNLSPTFLAQPHALEELHRNVSDAKPGVASFGNWRGLVVPKGTRQYEAQGLVNELPPHKHTVNVKKHFVFWSYSSFKLLICLLLWSFFSSCAIYLYVHDTLPVKSWKKPFILDPKVSLWPPFGWQSLPRQSESGVS